MNLLHINNIDPASRRRKFPKHKWPIVQRQPVPTVSFPRHSTPHTAHCTLRTPNFNFTLHTSHFTLHTSHFSLLPSHSKPHTSHFTLRSLHSKLKLHTPHCTLHTPHFTLLTSHCFLHTSHFTLHSLRPTLHTALNLRGTKKPLMRQNGENLLTNHCGSLHAATPIRFTKSSCKRQ